MTAIDAASGVVTLGDRDAVRSRGLRASRARWWVDRPTGPLACFVRIRSNHIPAAATIVANEAGGFQATFDEPQTAITPGQAAVIYDSEGWVVGGGWIDAAE